MRTWKRTGYKIIEADFDYSLHQYQVIRDNGEIVATITPGNLEDQNEIIKALETGEEVDGWEDGQGYRINCTG